MKWSFLLLFFVYFSTACMDEGSGKDLPADERVKEKIVHEIMELEKHIFELECRWETIERVMKMYESFQKDRIPVSERDEAFHKSQKQSLKEVLRALARCKTRRGFLKTSAIMDGVLEAADLEEINYRVFVETRCRAQESEPVLDDS